VSALRELYDYDRLRRIELPTIFRVQVGNSVVVLGGSQSVSVLDLVFLGEQNLRRRRGGGGLVLLSNADLIVDWWIPTGDSRWSSDVRESSRLVGRWWAEVLRDFVDDDVTIHDAGLEGDRDFRVVCFAGRGPGEVFVAGKKAVGLTQWRVREGVFVSTVVHASSSLQVLPFLRSVPEGIEPSLDHHTLASLGISDLHDVARRLRDASGLSSVVRVDLDN